MNARWDAFPLDVLLPSGERLAYARGIVTGQGMLLIYTTDGRIPVQRFAAAVHGQPTLAPPYAPRYASESSIPTTAGVVTCTRGQGCGCGNPLKSANLATLGVG